MKTSSGKTSLIIHGHFYQPPRENPKTGIIPKQESAYPFEDWNERIYKDCYSANTKSRYLDNNGRIISLTNNYEYISFNFGPTLVNWLEEKHPDTLDLIKEADKNSIKRLKHGNAIAQSFNHTILPLDSKRNAFLQIDWGLKSFQNTFHRDSEGLWLPECAINEEVVDILSENGIKFVILSPWQCMSLENEKGEIINLDGKPAPYYTPFKLKGKKGGEIAVFFYEHTLAEGISFGHYLQSADNLYSVLERIKEENKKPLIHTATDGEIYGHHEPYGDMALAALITKVNSRDDFIFDNYGSYLEKNPPKTYAILKEGEDKKGTSWSCSHGVSRWYKDCGCQTGGDNNWNQKWRTPLRNSLNSLQNSLNSIFDKEINSIFDGKIDSLSLLIEAGNVFSKEITMEEFIKTLHKNFNFDSNFDFKLMHLLVGMKNMFYSFTSCGWFFSDISGLEPRQDIKYALFAIQTFQNYFKEYLLLPFLENLKEAKSNIKTEGNGMTIAEEEMKGLSGEAEAALYFYLSQTINTLDIKANKYGFFTLLDYEKNDEKANLKIKNDQTGEEYSFNILTSSNIDKGMNFYLVETNDGNIERFRITKKDIPKKIIDETISWIDSKMCSLNEDDLIQLSDNMSTYATLVQESSNKDTNFLLKENLGLAIKLIKSLFLSTLSPEHNVRIETINNMLDFVKKYGNEDNKKAVEEIINSYFLLLNKNIHENGLNALILTDIINTLYSARNHNYEPEIKGLQDSLYEYYIKKKKTDVEESLLNEAFSTLNFK